jgi:hypothetical protein
MTNAKFINKEIFPVYCGYLGGKRFSNDEEVETEVLKWLRQQPKDFCAARFDELVKRCNKFINVCGGYIEEKFFFPDSNITCFMFYIDL